MKVLKVCFRCKEEKEVSEYSLKRGKPNAQCKKCKYAKDQIYRENNREMLANKSSAHWKQYKNTNRQKEVNRTKCETYRKAHPHVFRYHTAKRRTSQLQATPFWANMDKIYEIYANCPEGYHVDHAVPIVHDLVCGLHVEFNLQYLTKHENLSKSNKFYIE